MLRAKDAHCRRDRTGRICVGHLLFPPEIKDQLTQISLVDTPGLGAVTPRHREILQKEMEQADAIIFAVDSARPVKEDSLTAAALINENLFSGYSEQERERYAQKIFLVANKYDLILRPDESEAFRQSITELAATISNTLLEQVKSPTRNSRYFPVVAKLSLLAQVQAKGGQLDAADQTEYENMVRNVLHQTRQERAAHVPRNWTRSAISRACASRSLRSSPSAGCSSAWRRQMRASTAPSG